MTDLGRRGTADTWQAMWGHMDGDWGWWMIGGWIWMLAFWGVILGFVYMIVRRSGGDSAHATGSDALEILRRRYASGEIDEAEFRRRREELRR